MKATLISKDNNKAKFTIYFDADEFDGAVVEAYQKNKDKYNINGFRPGKAPRSIIEKHYGEGVFFEDAIDELLRTGYAKALDELDLEPIDSPDADFKDIGHGKPLEITIDVPIYPVVDVDNYKGIKVERVEEKITDKDVDRELENMQKRNSRMVAVEREVKDGDTVTLDYKGFVGDDQFEGGTAENQQLKIGSGTFIPGFEDQLKGAKAGEEVDVNVTFPEDYGEPSLAGKDAVFHCTVHEVREEQLPELNDDFAKDTSEYDTLEELKKATLDRLQETADIRSENAAKDALIEKVFEANKTDAPLSMVDDELNSMAREIDQNLRTQGLNFDLYLKYTGKTMDDFKDEMRAEAAKRVATRIVLRSIGEKENIKATDEDLDAEVQKLADAYKTTSDEVRSMLGEDGLKYFTKDITMTKVMDFLYDNAEVVQITEEEAKARAEKEMAEKEEKEKEAKAEKKE